MSGSDYTTTPNLGLFKPIYNQDAEQWAGHLNSNADVLDAALGSAAPGPFLRLAGGNMAGAVALAGVSTAPTAAPGVNTTQIASTAFVSAAMANVFVGTGTNDNAAAGMIGEYIFSEILVASQVAMTTNVGVNVTSISLTPGDWDITSSVVYNTASTTSVTFLAGAINTNTAALPTAPARGALALITQPAGVVPGAGNTYSLNAARRYSLAATTTVYLVARALFTLGTLNVFGFIGARRAR